MLLSDAMRLIDARVARGARIRITADPPMPRFGIPETYTVTLSGYTHHGHEMSTRCTAWKEADAVLSIGAFLSGLEPPHAS